jgi:hypothetical protein
MQLATDYADDEPSFTFAPHAGDTRHITVTAAAYHTAIGAGVQVGHIVYYKYTRTPLLTTIRT